MGAKRGFLTWEEAKEKVDERGFSTEEVELKDLDLGFRSSDGGGLECVMRVGKGEYAKTSKRAVRELGGVLKVNLQVLEPLTGNLELQRNVLDYLKSRSSVEGVGLLRDSGGVRSIVPDLSKYTPPERAFDVTRETLGDGGVGVAGTLYNRGMFEFMALTNKTDEPPRRRGEISHAGVNLKINGSVMVEPSVFTLVCTNGLISDRVVDRTEAFCDRDIREGVQRAVGLLRDFMALDDVEIPNRGATVARLNEELRLSDRAARRVSETVATNLAQGRVTAYDLINTVTRLSHGSGSSRYCRIGGEMLEPLKASRCGSCGARTL